MKKIEECDYTLMIFTENYNRELQEKLGRVEFERKLIDGLFLKGIKDRRIVPIMRGGVEGMSVLYSIKMSQYAY